MTDDEFLTLGLGILSVLMAMGLALLWRTKKPRQIGEAIAVMVLCVPLALIYGHDQMLTWLSGSGAPLLSLIQNPVASTTTSGVFAVLAFSLIFLLRKYTRTDC